VKLVSREENIDHALADVEPNRRQFMKRMSIGAVAVPVIASFSMDALNAAPAYAAPNSSV
jgi:hypothetical protein